MENLIPQLLDRPKIIGIVAETNQGKSNFLYYLIKDLLMDTYEYNLYTYGLRCDLGDKKIFSLAELETITNSVIICDEFYTLFDLEDRKSRKAIENSFRLINHNNNIIILCGLPHNYKKFVSSMVDTYIFKQCEIASFINGSRAKAICTQYKGPELGAQLLSLAQNEAIIYEKGYTKVTIPYMEAFDTKKENKKVVKKRT